MAIVYIILILPCTKLKYAKTPPTSSKHSHEGEKEIKQTGTSFMESYRDNLTTYITELMSNSVQYAHLVGWVGYKIENVSAED